MNKFINISIIILSLVLSATFTPTAFAGSSAVKQVKTVTVIKVNINQATAEQLADSLKGIGLKKAQRIVSYRKSHGAFKSINDLTQVSGIGSKTVAMNAKNIKL